MFHMDIWLSLVCGSIAWGALWSAGMLVLNVGRRHGRGSAVKLKRKPGA